MSWRVERVDGFDGFNGLSEFNEFMNCFQLSISSVLFY